MKRSRLGPDPPKQWLPMTLRMCNIMECDKNIMLVSRCQGTMLNGDMGDISITIK